MNGVLVLKNRCRKGRGRRGKKREVPTLNPGIDREMLTGIVVGNDACSGIVQPLIAVARPHRTLTCDVSAVQRRGLLLMDLQNRGFDPRTVWASWVPRSV